MSLLTHMKYSFVSSGADRDAFTVVSFNGFEAISKPYEFEILLVSDRTDIDPLKILQNPAVFTIHRDGEENVDFNGILMQFEETREFDGYLFYRAVLAPKFKWLSLTHHNQVFLNKSVPEIMESALKDGGLVSGIDFEFRLKETYLFFEYICQYDESHFDFVTRWAQREGMYYFFEQTSNGEKVVFTDTKISHVDLALGKDLIYVPPSGLDTAHTKEVVKGFVCRHNLLPARVHLKDYNYLRPSQAIEGIADVDPEGRGENYIYGVNFDTVEDGNRLAQIRAEALLCRKSLFHGESSVPYMVPGYTFDLHDYYKDAYNTKYLVTDVRHEGHQKGFLIAGLGEAVEQHEEQMFYSNTFESIYSDRQFRAEHTAQAPKITGTINAKIDAAGSGEYAEIDQYGRYKVILPFDLSGRFGGKASAWFRMMQPYAGPNQGMHFPLHKGTEVMLTFIDGDPDRPVIAGAVPNPETSSPVTANNQTKSVIQTGRSPHDASAGAGDARARSVSHPNNYIAFNDLLDHEEIEVHSPYKVDVFAGGKYARREIGPSEETGHDKYDPDDPFDLYTDSQDADDDIEGLKTNLENYAPSNVLGFDEKDKLDPSTATPPVGFPEEYEKAPVPSPPPEFVNFFNNTAIWCNTDLTLDQYLQQHATYIKETLLYSSGFLKSCSQLYASVDVAWEEVWNAWVESNHSNAKGYDNITFIDPMNAANTALTQSWYLIQDWVDLTQPPTYSIDKTISQAAWYAYCAREWTAWIDKRQKEWQRWQVHLTRGHIRASHRDTFNTQEGNIYDFGGYWNYNLGNNYVEEHIDQHAKLNASPKFDFLNGGGPQWSGFRTLSPDDDPQIPCAYGFQDSKNELDAWGKGKWGNGDIWVEKKFGDSYEYLDGNTISIHKGHTQEIIVGGRTVEEKYGKNASGSGYVKRSFFKSGGGKSWTKKWTKTGFLQSDEHTYTTGLNYEIKNNLSYNYGAKTNLSWDFSWSASLDFKVGAATSNSLFLSAKSDVTIGLGAAFSFDLKAAGKIAIDITAGIGLKASFGASMFLGVKGHLGGDHMYNTVSKKWTSDLPFTKVYKEAEIKAEKEKAAIAEAVLRIERRTAKIEAKKSWIDNSDVTFALGNLFRL